MNPQAWKWGANPIKNKGPKIVLNPLTLPVHNFNWADDYITPGVTLIELTHKILNIRQKFAFYDKIFVIGLAPSSL